MISEKENTRLSKLLSYILRHNPGKIGIELDKNGWINVDELISKLNAQTNQFNFEILKHIVDTNSKKRFAFNEDFSKIRASQGHSVEVELGYKEQQPPEILYHGTVEKFLSEISQASLKKIDRHHVHLSADKLTAMKIGERRGKPIVLTIRSGDMFLNNFKFYLSDNGVWLTDNVPSIYIEGL